MRLAFFQTSARKTNVASLEAGKPSANDYIRGGRYDEAEAPFGSRRKPKRGHSPISQRAYASVSDGE